MKRILALLCVLLATLPSNAGKPYRVFTSAEGTVFYILPRTIPCAKGSVANKAMEYDITCTTLSDSVSFTLTLTASATPADSLTLCFPDGSTKCYALQHIYTDLKGSNYVSRRRFFLTQNDVQQLFVEEVPPLLDFGNGISHTFSSKQWMKESREVNALLQVYEINVQSVKPNKL